MNDKERLIMEDTIKNRFDNRRIYVQIGRDIFKLDLSPFYHIDGDTSKGIQELSYILDNYDIRLLKEEAKK